MSNELKVSFYLKRESRLEKVSVGENVLSIGRINYALKIHGVFMVDMC
jgi:hypothetical protein